MGIVDRFKLTDIWKNGGINKPVEFALLTNEIYKGWSGMKASEYKEYKGVRKESLRDNMTYIELALTNIGKLDARDIAKEEHPQGLNENMKVAKRGGKVAKGARDLYEKETKKSAISIKEFSPFSINDVSIETVKLEHKKDWGADVPCYGYIFKSNNFKFAYMSDFNRILEIEKLKNCDLIISDGNGLNNKGHGHVGINGSIEIFNILKPKKMILTHLTHKMSYKDASAYVKKIWKH